MYFDMQLTIVVTNACDRRCELCVAQWLRRDEPRYMMTLDQIADFVVCTKQSDYRFRYVTVTGGEPTLWPYLQDAATMLGLARIADCLLLYSNGHNPKAFTPELMKLFSAAKLSGYPDEHYAEILARYPDKVSIYPITEHVVPPTEPVANSLPAQCLCFGPAYYDGRVYPCLGGFLDDHRMGRRTPGKPICRGYMDDFDPGKVVMQETCRYCVTNLPVWTASPKKPVTNNRR